MTPANLANSRGRKSRPFIARARTQASKPRLSRALIKALRWAVRVDSSWEEWLVGWSPSTCIW